MGAWGVNISNDDAAFDAHAAYLERYLAGLPHEAIVEEVLENFAETMADEGPSVWIGIAKAQWECGALSTHVSAEVRQRFASGEYLRGLDVSDHVRRQRALQTFLAKLATENPRPKARRQPRLQRPVFEAGDCLAICLDDGDYAAAIVTAAPEETLRPGETPAAVNVIAQLDYKSPRKPELADFERRNWLLHYASDHSWVVNIPARYFRGVCDRFEIVGRSVVRMGDPTTSSFLASSDFAEQVTRERHRRRELQ